MMRDAILPLLLMLGLLASSSSFKLLTHIATANEALKDIIVPLGSSGKPDFKRASLGELGTLRDVPASNPFVVEAVTRYRSEFRAGVLGPDCFPDLVGGQM